MGKYSDKSLKVSRKYLLHAKFEVAERIWFYLIPTAQGRVKWLRKHKKLAMLGEHVHWQPRKYPTDGNMLKVHDNVAIASNVEFTMHDIIHWIFDGMEGHRCFQEFADCIEINENVFIGAGARILPGVSVGPNAIVAAGAMEYIFMLLIVRLVSSAMGNTIMAMLLEIAIGAFWYLSFSVIYFYRTKNELFLSIISGLKRMIRK